MLMSKFRYPLELASALFPSVSHKTVSNWAERRILFTQFERPGHGRRRGYSRANLIELAMMVNLIKAGFSRENTRQAFTRRAASLNEGELCDSIDNLTEFRPGSTGYRWAVFCVAQPDDPKDRGRIAGCKVLAEREADKLMKRHSEDAFSIIPVSSIVGQVDRAIADWEAKQ